MPSAEALYFIRNSRLSIVRRSSEYSLIQPTLGSAAARGSTVTLTPAGYAAGTRLPCSLTKRLQTVCDTAPDGRAPRRNRRFPARADARGHGAVHQRADGGS